MANMPNTYAVCSESARLRMRANEAVQRATAILEHSKRLEKTVESNLNGTNGNEMAAKQEHERTARQARSRSKKARESQNELQQELERMQETASSALKDAQERQQRRTTKANRMKRAKSVGV